MTTRPHSSFKIVFILGLLAMLMPLSIDMYLPALPVISAQFGVPAGSAQMTLSTYILGLPSVSSFMAQWPTAWGVNQLFWGDIDICRGGGGLRAGAEYRSADCDAFLPWPGGGCGKRGN